MDVLGRKRADLSPSPSELVYDPEEYLACALQLGEGCFLGVCGRFLAVGLLFVSGCRLLWKLPPSLNTMSRVCSLGRAQ